jgi:hypothetical protein
MLRAWIEDLIGRLRQLGLHADGLEEECRRLQAELSPFTRPDAVMTTPSWSDSRTRRCDPDRHHRLGPESPSRTGRIPGVRDPVP